MSTFHAGNRQTTAQHTRNWQRAATCGNLWQSRLSTLFATRKLKFNLFLLPQLLDEMRALGRVKARWAIIKLQRQPESRQQYNNLNGFAEL